MPAPDFNPRWFEHHTLRVAWYHEDGWVIYPSGATHEAPADMVNAGFQLRKLGYDGRVTYKPFGENPFSAAYRGGGRIYYMPLLNRAINSKTGVRSLVGKSQTASETPPQGFDGVWSLNAELSTSAKNYWRVAAVIRAEGLGNAVIPWWDGKSYPQWPPLPRGRPPAD
jgi:hypothetical protein